MKQKYDILVFMSSSIKKIYFVKNICSYNLSKSKPKFLLNLKKNHLFSFKFILENINKFSNIYSAT